QAQGRLDIRHGVGVFVVEPSALAGLGESLRRQDVDIDELFAMREVLEVPAASWAARSAGEADLARLREILDNLNAAFDADPADFRQLATLDASFHLGIADIAGNRFLRSTSSLLHDILISGMKTTLLIPGRREISRRQHEAILAAIAAQNSGAAGQAAR
ncbi:MAG: FadR family transcriptional regulator, partial [Microlunatus sp.]|nr:FadR family transcriptional regulator [Microlunatus sp.]